MVVIDGMSLRKTAQQLGISAMTVQRRVKRGLNICPDSVKSGLSLSVAIHLLLKCLDGGVER